MTDGPSAVLVYDDSVPVPPQTIAVAGVNRFGDLLRRRRRLSATVREFALAAGFDDAVHLGEPRARSVLAASLRVDTHADRLHLLLPAHLAPTADPEDAVLFLRKLRQLTEPVALWHGSRPVGAGLLDRDGLLSYLGEGDAALEAPSAFLDDVVGALPGVGDGLHLIDLRELTSILEFLSGSFSARHFNQVAHDRHYVVKRSSDRRKMHREHDFWQLLPPAMQPFFVQPFDLHDEDDGGASYRMRRVFVPDLAVQWVHGALTAPQLDAALDRLFHVLEVRPRREVGTARAAELAKELFVGKVRSRVEDLLALPGGASVEAALRAGGVPEGIHGLVDRYERLWSRTGCGRGHSELAITHGDLCFSNILYSPATQSLELIDPRGATEEAELFSDPLYDVAKLSHSILGSYDFIVAGLYELVHGEDLVLSLQLDPAPDAALQQRFLPMLERGGFPLELVRACEVSLFLSMLPLHMDNPKRVVAFAIRARDILDELGAR